MYKSSLKLYLVTVLLTLTLASLSFAGDVQCPLAPPPPPQDGDTGNGGLVIVIDTHDVLNDNIKYIKDLLSFLIKL